MVYAHPKILPGECDVQTSQGQKTRLNNNLKKKKQNKKIPAELWTLLSRQTTKGK